MQQKSLDAFKAVPDWAYFRNLSPNRDVHPQFLPKQFSRRFRIQPLFLLVDISKQTFPIRFRARRTEGPFRTKPARIMSVKYQIHDAHDLQLQVHFVLSRNPYVGHHNIRCEIVDEDVVLKGSVKTYYQKQMAQESLRKITGIRRVMNELSVVIG